MIRKDNVENHQQSSSNTQPPTDPVLAKHPKRRAVRKDRHHNHDGECPKCAAKLRAKDRRITALQSEVKALKPSNTNRCSVAWQDLTLKGRQSRKRKYNEAFENMSANFSDDIQKIHVQLETTNGQVLTFKPRDTENDAEEVNVEDADENRCLVSFLNVKDTFHISDECWHELAQIKSRKGIPTLNRIKQQRTIQNQLIEISEIPQAEDGEGCYRSVAHVLTHLIKNNNSLMNGSEDVINLTVKFSCDGAKLGKHFSGVKAAICIITDRNYKPGIVKGSPDDESLIFIYKGDESYAEQQRNVNNTFTEMKQIGENGIKVEGKHINIKWIAVCDWKAAAILLGLNPANSNYFCIWCFCTKSEILKFDDDTDWDISRSTQLVSACLASQNQRGQIRKPLLPLEFDCVIIDTLHLFLRIQGKLLDQVIIWAIEQKREWNLLREMKRIRVPFKINQEESSNSITKWSSLDGEDLMKVAKLMNLSNVLKDKEDRRYSRLDALTAGDIKHYLRQLGHNCQGKKSELLVRLKDALKQDTTLQYTKQRSGKFKLHTSELNAAFDENKAGSSQPPHTPNLVVKDIQELWADFLYLYEVLRTPPGGLGYLSPEAFKERAKEWGNKFRECTFDEDVTPYIHAFVYHVPTFLESFKFIHDLGTQRLEKKNHQHQSLYHRGTSKGGGRYKTKFAMQIMQYENRRGYCKIHHQKRVKRKYTRRERRTVAHLFDRDSDDNSGDENEHCS